ncbi:MAG: helix-turn-helix domain-containing protein [Rhodanobacter sp.]
MTDFIPAQELVSELAVALQEAKGIPFEDAASYAEPIVRYLQQQHGGDELYIPQPYVRRDVSDILAFRDSGLPVKDICRRFAISRRTYYRLLSQL